MIETKHHKRNLNFTKRPRVIIEIADRTPQWHDETVDAFIKLIRGIETILESVIKMAPLNL